MIDNVKGFISGDATFMAAERRLERIRQARQIRMLEDVDAYGLRKGDVVDALPDADAWRGMLTQLVLHAQPPLAEVVK